MLHLVQSAKCYVLNAASPIYNYRACRLQGIITRAKSVQILFDLCGNLWGGLNEKARQSRVGFTDQSTPSCRILSHTSSTAKLADLAQLRNPRRSPRRALLSQKDHLRCLAGHRGCWPQAYSRNLGTCEVFVRSLFSFALVQLQRHVQLSHVQRQSLEENRSTPSSFS